MSDTPDKPSEEAMELAKILFCDHNTILYGEVKAAARLIDALIAKRLAAVVKAVKANCYLESCPICDKIDRIARGEK